MSRQAILGVVVVASIGAGIGAARTASGVPVTSGLVGYWAGDGNATDGSGFGNNGTLVGDATFAAGQVGQAFSFDGVGDAMRASAAALPTGDADRSIAFFVFSDDFAFGNRFLAGWGNVAAAQMSSVVLGLGNTADRRPSFWGTNQDLGTSASLTNSQWHHIAFTLDTASNAGVVYVDGLSAGAGALVLNTPAGTMFRLADVQSPMGNFQGRLDEVAVYNRTLTPAEVATLAGVPEPGGVMILGMTGLALCLKRRRSRGVVE